MKVKYDFSDEEKKTLASKSKNGYNVKLNYDIDKQKNKMGNQERGSMFKMKNRRSVNNRPK